MEGLNGNEWEFVVTPKTAFWHPYNEHPELAEPVRERVLDKYRRWHKLIQAVEEYAHPELMEELRKVKDEIH